MYFPVGWPTVLKSNGATSGSPVKLLKLRTKSYVIELRERSVAFWQSRVRKYQFSNTILNEAHYMFSCNSI